MRILIVDDEHLARSRLRRLTSELMPAAVLDEAPDALSALAKIGEFKPELVLLDVQMPGMTGLEFLDQVEAPDFQVVFQTAFDEFAVEAFEKSAVDYLLKPFTKERLEKALSRASRNLDARRQLSQLGHARGQAGDWLSSLVIKKGLRRIMLPVTEVEAFISREHLSFALAEREEIVDLSLTALEARLDPKRFLRVHRNAIVSLPHVREARARQLVTKSGREIEVSRSSWTATVKALKF